MKRRGSFSVLLRMAVLAMLAIASASDDPGARAASCSDHPGRGSPDATRVRCGDAQGLRAHPKAWRHSPMGRARQLHPV
jgi:hypothetical protein